MNIHTGKHRPAWWFFNLRLWYNKKEITRYVYFDTSAKYDLPGEDNDADINKLFGIGYLWDRKESARFGWEWNNIDGTLDIYAYYHDSTISNSMNVNGAIDFVKIRSIELNTKYKMTIRITADTYTFIIKNMMTSVVNELSVQKNHAKKLCYYLGLFFGGTLPAPHPIKVIIKK